MGFFDDHRNDPIRELSPEHVTYLRRVLDVHANRAPTGLCQVCRVRSCADWRDAFGGEAPPLLEVAIGTDADDTRAHVAATIERLRFSACP